MVLAILILAAVCTAMLVFLICFAAFQCVQEKRRDAAWRAELSGNYRKADEQFGSLRCWCERLDKLLLEQDRDIKRGMEILRAMEEKERRLDYDFDAAQRAAQEINRMNEGIAQIFGYDGAPVQKKAGDGE